MSATQRLLDASLIPPTLWDAENGALWVPPVLARAYVARIQARGLIRLSETRDPDNPPVGGLTQELTDKHFAQAFDGSVARAELALLDPKGEVNHASDTCLRGLAGDRLRLTDAPCGAGAASLAFLATIAELRAKNVLPRQPLTVVLLGAELSNPARAYALEMLKDLTSALEAQAIFVEAEFLRWDITDALSNTDLIRRMTQLAIAYPTLLLVVANFNAFLVREGKRKDAEAQLGELFRYASGSESAAIWIEPDMNRAIAKGGLFSWLGLLLEGAWRLFARHQSGGDAPVSTTAARFHLPLNPARLARVGLAVMPISLERSR